MANERWGTPTSWTAAFTSSNLNSLANGNALQGNAIDNSSNLYVFSDVTLHLASMTAAAPNFVGLYLYPMNDGSTYGDGRFTSSATGPPPSNYMVGTFGFATGTGAKDGTITGIIIPPGSFKFLLYNMAGANFASSGNTLLYRTYNRVIA